MSKKLYIIVALVFLCGSARASDSLSVDWSQEDVKVPYRTHFFRGNQIPPQEIELIHQKDCCPDGWKYSNQEWSKMLLFPVAPEYDRDDQHGSNGGVARA